MGYRHGDLQFICDGCGRYLDISPFSSFPLSILNDHDWVYEMSIVIDKKNILKENKLPPINIKCDLCKRSEKIDKIKKRNH